MPRVKTAFWLEKVGGGKGGAPALPLILAESASGICGRVWDSGVALCEWLGEGGLAIGDGDLVLEIGSGVGVGGIDGSGP